MRKLLYGLFICTHAVFEKHKIKQYQLRALDCDRPSHIRHSKLSQICGRPKDEQNHTATEIVDVTILQHEPSTKLKAVRCTKKETSMLLFCGAYSHMKLMQPATISSDAPISLDECRNALLHGLVKDELGKPHQISLNQPLIYKIMRHGNVHATPENVACEGESFFVNGKIHAGMLEFVTTQLSIVETEVEYDNRHGLKDLGTQERLPFRCKHDMACSHYGRTYVLLQPETWCKLYKVQRLLMQIEYVQTKDGLKKCFVSHEHKLFFQVQEKFDKPAECTLSSHILNTNYQKIKIMVDADVSSLNVISGTELDLDLEVRVVTAYANFMSEKR